MQILQNRKSTLTEWIQQYQHDPDYQTAKGRGQLRRWTSQLMDAFTPWERVAWHLGRGRGYQYLWHKASRQSIYYLAQRPWEMETHLDLSTDIYLSVNTTARSYGKYKRASRSRPLFHVNAFSVDLDDADPSRLPFAPSALVETSPE